MMFSSLLITTLAAGIASPQSNGEWLSGFEKEIRGEQIGYESALPSVNSALLVRSLDAERSIAWQTPVMPEAVPEGGVALTWLFGMDASPEQHQFELRLNGKPLLTFLNPASETLEPWTIVGDVISGEISEQGEAISHPPAELIFRPTHIDRHQDVFGFAQLKLPAAMVTPGEAMTLEVIGESAGSWIWYMTFRHSPAESIRITPHNALLRSEDMGVPASIQEMMMEIVHLGEPVRVQLEASWGYGSVADLKLGANRIRLLNHQPAEMAQSHHVDLTYPDGEVVKVPVELKPVKPWVIHLVQHTHTDLGYTRPQTEILADHLRYIDFALDYCDQTDHFPDDAKFRWTCEAAWPVQEYLRYRPQTQIDRLRKRIEEGRIELTAMFANLSELLDDRACAASLAPIAEMRKHNLPVESAMQNDVNGIAWIYADLLSEMGVRYLTMGEHGHRALIPFDVPTAFWWESPSGARMLAWRPDHYNTGNFWGMHSGNIDAVEAPVFRYLGELLEKGYEMDHISVQYGGVFLDNAPPGIKANELIRDWNQKYIWPRMRSSLGTEMLKWVEDSPHSIPTYRAAWPDWWSDGIASAPREVAAVRQTQSQLANTEALLAMAQLSGLEIPEHLLDRIDRVWEQLVIYGEHTYGAAESVTDPDAENSKVQWAEKSAYAWDAVKEAAIVQEAAFGLMQTQWPRLQEPSIVVSNPSGWPRSGLVKVFLDKELLSLGQSFQIVDADGNVAAAQLWQAKHDGNWWAFHAEKIPALGWKSYALQVGDAEVAYSQPVQVSAELETDWYKVKIDAGRGGLTSLYDVEFGWELADADSQWAMGQLIHEQLGNRWQLEHFMLDDFSRNAINKLELQPGADGPLWKSAILRGSCELAPSPNGVEIEIRLYKLEAKVEFRYRIRKRPSTDPESLYAAFPFAGFPSPNGLNDKVRITYDSTGSEVNPETQHLPRTSTDWQSAKRFVKLRTDWFQITLSSPEILLHQLGGIHLGKFREKAVSKRPHVYSWLFNNYWVTNFVADQSGELIWTQSISSGESTQCSDEKLWFQYTGHRRAWDHHSPLLARVLPPNASSAEISKRIGQVLHIEGDHIALVGARPAANGQILLQLREIDGQGGRLQVSNQDGMTYLLHRADALGQPLEGTLLSGRIDAYLAPHENAHYLLGKQAVLEPRK